MKAAIRGGALGSMLLVTVACGPASVQRVSGPSGALPRPDRILVYDFAVTPDEVRPTQASAHNSANSSGVVRIPGHPEPPRKSRSGMRWPMPWPTPS